jgi:hypothetical protein
MAADCTDNAGAAMSSELHIIEPTLTDDAGHCHSLVRSLAQAAPECDVTVWAATGAAAIWQGPGRLQPFFRRRWRRLQALWLYRRLLRAPGRILVATAGSSDLLSADWAAAGTIPPHKLFMFVHWLGRKAAKATWLTALAKRQPHMEILAPTQAVTSFFASCGFRASLVPYPIDAGTRPVPTWSVFRHLVVAGGARLDKGFDHVVDLVLEMQRRGASIPIVVQTSMESRHRDDPALAMQIDRLRAANYPTLRILEETLTREQYLGLFEGGIALQPYRAADFEDRVSGVTLDALAAGCPLVVTEGTWMARLARRFDAGITTADLSGAGLLAACERAKADHTRYAANALAASLAVTEAHSARQLLDVVLQRSPAQARP